MPKAPKKKGRRRKFKNGDLAWHEKHGWVVIVDRVTYEGAVTPPYYRVVRVLHPFNGAPYGEALWIKSPYLRKPTGDEQRTRKKVLPIYNANNRMQDRGCRCNCCAHTAIPNNMIRKDGTFKWEDEEE